MGKMLSDGQIEGFRRDGFIYGLNALTQEEAAECRRCLEEYETRTGQSAQESLTLKSPVQPPDPP